MFNTLWSGRCEIWRARLERGHGSKISVRLSYNHGVLTVKTFRKSCKWHQFPEYTLACWFYGLSVIALCFLMLFTWWCLVKNERKLKMHTLLTHFYGQMLQFCDIGQDVQMCISKNIPTKTKLLCLSHVDNDMELIPSSVTVTGIVRNFLTRTQTWRYEHDNNTMTLLTTWIMRRTLNFDHQLHSEIDIGG